MQRKREISIYTTMMTVKKFLVHVRNKCEVRVIFPSKMLKKYLPCCLLVSYTTDVLCLFCLHMCTCMATNTVLRSCNPHNKVVNACLAIRRKNALLKTCLEKYSRMQVQYVYVLYSTICHSTVQHTGIKLKSYLAIVTSSLLV